MVFICLPTFLPLWCDEGVKVRHSEVWFLCVCLFAHGLTSICVSDVSLGLFRYSCSSRASEGKKCPPGNAAEKLTFRIPPGAASRSGWMLKMKTSSTGTERTADTPSKKVPSSGDRKCSWDMFWRRTVTLLPNMSSVIMRTRRTHWAEMLWTPSEELKKIAEGSQLGERIEEELMQVIRKEKARKSEWHSQWPGCGRGTEWKKKLWEEASEEEVRNDRDDRRAEIFTNAKIKQEVVTTVLT